MNRPLLAMFGLGAVAALAGCAGAGSADRGDRSVKDQQWDEAIVAYEDALSRDVDNPRLRGKLDNARRGAAAHYHVLGRKAEEGSDLNAALVAYDKAVGFQPDHSAARTDRSKVRRLRTVTEREVRKVEARLAEGDCLSAKAGFERLYAWRPTFPEIEAGRVAALTQCFDASVAVAKVFLDLGDPDAAEPFLQEAEGFFPKHPEVARLRGQAGGAQAAGAKIAEGHGLLLDGRYADAAKAYRQGFAKDPSRADARDALIKATRMEVAARMKGTARDIDKGRWQAALTSLEAASAVGPEDEGVRTRLTASSTELRKKAAARLYKLGLRADDSGLFGAAWVWYRLAGLVGRPFSDADLKARLALGRINEAAPYRILVTPVAQETDLHGLAAEITRDLVAVVAADIEAAGAKVTLTLDPNVQPPPDGILRGRLTQFKTPAPTVRTTGRALDWRPPAKVSTNPKAGEALKAYVEAVAAEDADAMATSLEVLKATGATVRETPTSEPVKIPSLGVTWEAVAGAELELYDRANDRVVTAAYSDVEVRFKDTASPAVEAVGMTEDPLHVLSARALRRRLVVDVVEDLRGQLSPALSMAGLRFRRLAERVQGDARLHYLVLALVAGSPDAEAMREELLRATGYRFGEDTYDPSKLPL